MENEWACVISVRVRFPLRVLGGIGKDLIREIFESEVESVFWEFFYCEGAGVKFSSVNVEYDDANSR